MLAFHLVIIPSVFLSSILCSEIRDNSKFLSRAGRRVVNRKVERRQQERKEARQDERATTTATEEPVIATTTTTTTDPLTTESAEQRSFYDYDDVEDKFERVEDIDTPAAYRRVEDRDMPVVERKRVQKIGRRRTNQRKNWRRDEKRKELMKMKKEPKFWSKGDSYLDRVEERRLRRQREKGKYFEEDDMDQSSSGRDKRMQLRKTQRQFKKIRRGSSSYSGSSSGDRHSERQLRRQEIRRQRVKKKHKEHARDNPDTTDPEDKDDDDKLDELRNTILNHLQDRKDGVSRGVYYNHHLNTDSLVPITGSAATEGFINSLGSAVHQVFLVIVVAGSISLMITMFSWFFSSSQDHHYPSYSGYGPPPSAFEYNPHTRRHSPPHYILDLLSQNNFDSLLEKIRAGASSGLGRMSQDTMEELSYLLQNANISDCLSQTLCYYNKYRNNNNIEKMPSSHEMESRSTQYHQDFPVYRHRRSSDVDMKECETSKCDLATMGLNAYQTFNTIKNMANIFTQNNIV